MNRLKFDGTLGLRIRAGRSVGSYLIDRQALEDDAGVVPQNKQGSCWSSHAQDIGCLPSSPRSSSKSIFPFSHSSF